MAKFTLVQDSSQISMFLECPQKWLNYYMRGLQPVQFYDEDEFMNQGTYGHRLLDIYYRMRSQGASFNEAISAFNDFNPDTDMCECGCPKDYHCPIPELNIIECRRCKKCAAFRPKPFILNVLSRGKVRKRIAEYASKYANSDDIQPLSPQHVEIGFSEAIHEDSDNLFILEGRIDVIGKIQGLECFMDHKLQSKTYWLYNKSVQFKNYALITRLNTGVINYIRLGNKIDETTLVRELINFNSVELVAWHRRLIQIFMRMKRTYQTAQNNNNEVERNWNACSGGRLTYDREKPQYCWFTNLCEEFDPTVIKNKEHVLYKIREQAWRPW